MAIEFPKGPVQERGDLGSLRLPAERSEFKRRLMTEEPSEALQALSEHVNDGGLLRKGAKGEAVAELQMALNIISGRDRFQTLGNYGDVTDKAIRRFQREHGLDEDGIVGEDTLAAIETALTKFRQVHVREGSALSVVADLSRDPLQLRLEVPHHAEMPTGKRVPIRVPTSLHKNEEVPTELRRLPWRIVDGYVSKTGEFPDGRQFGKPAELKVFKVQPNLELRQDAAEAFIDMQKQAIRDGVGRIEINNSFRTDEEQQVLIDLHASDPTKPGANPIGMSTHQFALAFDGPASGPQLAWLVENGPKYGFIQPHSKTEQWHFEYRGRPASDQTLVG